LTAIAPARSLGDALKISLAAAVRPPPSNVIPAKAGIQLHVVARLRWIPCSMDPGFRRDPLNKVSGFRRDDLAVEPEALFQWIPASAGMTSRWSREVIS
jgi:hypothetical protein